MGQSLASSNKDSQSSDPESKSRSKKLHRFRKVRANYSFRRHSLLNIFNSNKNINNPETSSIKQNNSDSNLPGKSSGSEYSSSNTIDSLNIGLRNNQKPVNSQLEHLKRRESKSLSPALNKKPLPPHTLPIPAHLINARRMVLKPKTNQIYDDYFISKEVLGLGISGKVLSCTCKKTQSRFALKVSWQTYV